MNDIETIKAMGCSKVIFVADGGVGRAIAGTAVVKRLKEELPHVEIVVVTGYPDIYTYHPDVEKTYNFNNPLYFYDDHVKEGTYIIHHEPYRHNDYLFGESHLIDVWCKLIGMERNGANPNIHFLRKEEEAALVYVNKLTEDRKKKLVLFQWVGGIVPESKDKHKFMEAQARMHKRSLPEKVAQKVVNKLVSQKYVVGLVQHENYPTLNGAERVYFPIRNVLVLMKYAEAFIGIDSFLQHGAMNFGLPGVVCWGGTSAKRLGYEEHTNLSLHDQAALEGKKLCKFPGGCHRPNSYIFDANPVNQIWNCPVDEVCMDFDPEFIVSKFNELIKSKNKSSTKKEKASE